MYTNSVLKTKNVGVEASKNATSVKYVTPMFTQRNAMANTE